jgi:hypothetical protein
MLQTIDTWEVQQLAYLLQKMQAVDEGNGASLLDNTALFFSSEIEDGDSHAHDNMPILVGGRAGGAIASGRHVRCRKDTPVANLFVALSRALGSELGAFGDSTGVLSELSA